MPRDLAYLRADMTFAEAMRHWPQAIRPLANHLRACGQAASPTCLLQELASHFGMSPEQLLAEMRAVIERTDRCPWNDDCLCR